MKKRNQKTKNKNRKNKKKNSQILLRHSIPGNGRLPPINVSSQAKAKREAERRTCVALCVELDKLGLVHRSKKVDLNGVGLLGFFF